MRCAARSFGSALALRELGPLLAEEGIDVNIDVSDMETVQNALNRAVERRSMALFTPVGLLPELALTTLRWPSRPSPTMTPRWPAAVLEQAEPESPDNLAPAVSACIGARPARRQAIRAPPAGLGQRTRLPTGHWTGECDATDILVLARKRRAFRSLDTLLIKRGGHNVLCGGALALAAAFAGLVTRTGIQVPDLTRTMIR